MQRSTRIRWALAVQLAAFAACAASFVVDRTMAAHALNLFPRSGSLIAISATILEYQLWVKTTQAQVQDDAAGPSSNDTGITRSVSSAERRLRVLAHSCAVLGALIWAYGDLLVRYA